MPTRNISLTQEQDAVVESPVKTAASEPAPFTVFNRSSQSSDHRPPA